MPARPRRVIAAVVIVALVGVGVLIQSHGSKPSIAPPAGKQDAVERPFAATSFWNTQLPNVTPTDPKSAAYVSNITQQIDKYYGTVGINTTQYTPPVYLVDDKQPTVDVKFNDCQNKGSADKNLLQQWKAVPIPPDARAARGSDAEMVVWQPSTDTVWELWQAQKRTDGWYACWGGKITNASTSQGVFTGGYGVAASGLSLLGGLIRVGELRAGKIDHAVAIALVEPKKGEYSWPANRSDGWSTSDSAVPQGQRFRLDPSVNVDLLPMTVAGKSIARAIQQYGLVVRDKAGAVMLYAENAATFTDAGMKDPYPGLFDNKPAYAVMQGFPWDKLQALPFDYGK